MLAWSDFSDVTLFRTALFELDLRRVEQTRKSAPPFHRWQRSQNALRAVLGKAAPVELGEGRYSPDGKSIAVAAIRKTTQPGEWKSLDFELGVVDRAASTYRKVAWYEEGLCGPVCWSPDGREILFSRPLKEGDKREGGKEEGALRQEWGLGLWSIRPDGTGERFLTTGWCPDWR